MLIKNVPLLFAMMIFFLSCSKEAPTEDYFLSYNFITIYLHHKHSGLLDDPFNLFYRTNGYYDIADHHANLSVGKYKKISKDLGVVEYTVLGRKYELYLKFMTKRRGSYEFYIDGQICEMGSFTIDYSNIEQ